MNPEEMDYRSGMLTLNGLSKLGPITNRRLLEQFEHDPQSIFRASRDQLLSIKGVGPSMVASIKDAAHEEWILKEKQNLKNHFSSFILGDEFPELLNQIHDPPLGLYKKGEIPPGPYFSIVGTRIPSEYSKKICREIASYLAQRGFCIVSGLARGIDSIAHRAALEAEGKTIAFLGNGLDIVYPPENLDLYREISEHGALLTEFPFGRKPDKKTFPMRNRLVSGISSGVLVVESGRTGGSLITARLAADQGRSVFAIPGRVDLDSSIGCHKLIREGATLVHSSQDIIEDLLPILPSFHFSDEKQIESKVPKSSFNQEISNNENLILKLLVDGRILNAEEICSESNLSIKETSIGISLLELKSLISKRSDGKYEVS